MVEITHPNMLRGTRFDVSNATREQATTEILQGFSPKRTSLLLINGNTSDSSVALLDRDYVRKLFTVCHGIDTGTKYTGWGNPNIPHSKIGQIVMDDLVTGLEFILYHILQLHGKRKELPNGVETAFKNFFSKVVWEKFNPLEFGMIATIEGKKRITGIETFGDDFKQYELANTTSTLIREEMNAIYAAIQGNPDMLLIRDGTQVEMHVAPFKAGQIHKSEGRYQLPFRVNEYLTQIVENKIGLCFQDATQNDDLKKHGYLSFYAIYQNADGSNNKLVISADNRIGFKKYKPNKKAYHCGWNGGFDIQESI